MFYKKQKMYHGKKSQLLKVSNPTPYLTSTLKKDALILDFSELVNSQVAVTTAKSFNKFTDGIIKFIRSLFTVCLQFVHVLTYFVIAILTIL